ncbi:extended synaptotagmin-2 [Vairimorpha necatrix]|uniref:Extended synaptotagmin-2 n=1 Tax=Vairimorpha necatrix TaxID=6039 RepID=A0AAX4J9W5_9MICR
MHKQEDENSEKVDQVENSLIRRNLSKPISPRSIPVKHKSALPKHYKSSIVEYQSALDLEPKEGLFFYLKIPSLIFLGVLGGYFVGRFRFSFLNVLFVGYAVYFVYKRKVDKFTTSLKSLVHDNARREKCKYSGETVEWMNFILNKFWKVAEPVVSSDIYQNVNRELLKVCPPFLRDLRLTEFTLGSRAPVIEQITFHSSKENKVTLDCSVSFIPLEATVDAIEYYLGEDKQWNSKIILKARLGTRNNLGINLPILVKEICFKGRIRATLNLINKNNFIKDVEVCLMEIPHFDFTLVPLKIVDIMDVPGLSTWIKKTIINEMSKLVINPNSITIDIDKISQSQGYEIGVACLQILNLENEEDEKLTGEIDVDNIPLYQTNQKTGRNLVFNEYFYTILQNVDEKIGINFYGEGKITGQIFLNYENLKESEKTKTLEDGNEQNTNGNSISTNSKQSRMKRNKFDKVRLIKNEQTYAYLNTNLIFYPITNIRTNSAIVTLKLIGVENMLSLDNDKSLYSSYCCIIVSPLHKDKNSIPFEYIKNTSSAAALVVSHVLKTDDHDINNIKTGNNSLSLKLLPSSDSTFYIFESKRVFNNNSPNYNEIFKFFSRDLQVDVVSICIINDRNSEIIGRVGINLQDLVEGKPIKYKLKDARSGTLEAQFDFQYINLEQENNNFINYISVQKITVETVSEQGIFYGVVETSLDIFKMDPFTSSLPIKKSIFVPVHDNDKMKFKLYKETSNGDVFLGEEEISINYTGESKRLGLILPDNISVVLRIEGEFLEDFKGSPSKKENLKIIQVQFGEFEGLNEEIFIELLKIDTRYNNNENSNNSLDNRYTSSNYRLDSKVASAYSRNKKINNVFTILLGNEDLLALVKVADQGENRILGSLFLPLRFTNEKISFNEFGLSADIKVQIQTCNYFLPLNLKKGFLEIYIKSAKNLKSSERGRVNAYVKVLVNDNTVYKTKSASESNDPIFYESFVMPVDKIRDIFCIQIYDQYSSSKNSLLCFVEFPLHNILEGFSEVDFKMMDSKSFKRSESSLRIGFNFCRDSKTLKVKKRNILGDFFNF